MKPVNLLNRCTVFFLRFTLLITQIFGVTVFKYDKRKQQFVHSKLLRSYVLMLLVLNFIIVLVTLATLKLRLGSNRALLLSIIVFIMRLHLILYGSRCIRLFNDMQQMLWKLRRLARHPNIFRMSHLVLVLLTLQSLMRSLFSMFSSMHLQSTAYVIRLVHYWIFTSIMFMFLLQITLNICLFIVLIACYDELHQCTRRISNDVRTLRLAQVLEDGQLLLLVEQLCSVTAQLIRLRTHVLRLTKQLIKHYRFYWLWTFLYWLLPDATLYAEAVAMLNIAFYCTIFEIFVWKSKLSRSFWNLHLINYHAGFDRTIDELLHLEIVERIKIAVYGITLDMKFLFKLLSICILYIFIGAHNYNQRQSHSHGYSYSFSHSYSHIPLGQKLAVPPAQLSN